MGFKVLLLWVARPGHRCRDGTGLLSLERHDDVAVVTLQRPEKRNALSIDLRIELTDAFSALGEDDGVGAIVLTGRRPRILLGDGRDPVRRRPRPPASA